jgi:hypothetical protein
VQESSGEQAHYQQEQWSHRWKFRVHQWLSRTHTHSYIPLGLIGRMESIMLMPLLLHEYLAVPVIEAALLASS